jgi:uncharacterized protein YkwD
MRKRAMVLGALGAGGLLSLASLVAAQTPDTPPPSGATALGAPAHLNADPWLPLGLGYTGCGGVTTAPVNAGWEQQVVEITNQERLANGGLAPLKRVDPLMNASRYHSADMAQDSYFDHDSYDRVSGNLVLACGFSDRVGSYYANWLSIAENIAAGYASPGQAMAALMASPGHRANILNTGVWEQGAGYAAGGPYGHYWAQDFGRRQGVYPLVIEREAASTNAAAVHLYVYGSWSEIRLRNENGTFGPWQPFSANLTWTLSAGPPGPRTVFAEMRANSLAASASDDILLNAAVPTPTVTAGTTPTATPAPSPTPLAVARGDCNGDRSVNAGDISALSLELFDGDGTAAANAPGGTFPGQPGGCDANADAVINAGDVSCTVLLVFNGPGACP